MPENRGQQVVEIVRNAAGQQAKLFQFLRLLHPRLKLLAFMLASSAFGEVTNKCAKAVVLPLA